jgi:hypothetical protein
MVDYPARLKQMAMEASGEDEAALLWGLNEIEKWREAASLLKVALDESRVRVFRLEARVSGAGELK